MSRTRKFIGLWLTLIIFVIVFPGLFYFISSQLDRVFSFNQFMSYGIGIILAAGAVLIGIFWVFWAYSYLHFVGKGTPIEAFGYALYPTQKLVETGPYAYTRNPMLFGLLFILLSIALYIQSISGLILIPVLAVTALLYIRAFEEPQLRKRFGREYEEYRKSVPVLLPSIKPGRS